MNASKFVSEISRPGQAWMISVLGPTPLWTPMNSDRALVMLTAIAGQESDWTALVQGGGGPAHSYWQYEGGKGELLDAVLTGDITRDWAEKLCAACKMEPIRTKVWEAFAAPEFQQLAFGISRLALYADPPSLPDIGSADAAWSLYLRLWEPGKPSRSRWTEVYTPAVFAVTDKTTAQSS